MTKQHLLLGGTALALALLLLGAAAQVTRREFEGLEKKVAELEKATKYNKAHLGLLKARIERLEASIEGKAEREGVQGKVKGEKLGAVAGSDEEAENWEWVQVLKLDGADEHTPHRILELPSLWRIRGRSFGDRTVSVMIYPIDSQTKWTKGRRGRVPGVGLTYIPPMPYKEGERAVLLFEGSEEKETPVMQRPKRPVMLYFKGGGCADVVIEKAVEKTAYDQ